MATVDKTQATGIPASGMGKSFVMHNYIDFTVAANQLIQNATVAVFDVPAHILVEKVMMRIVTGDADIETLRVGIEGGTTDGFIANTDIANPGWVLCPLAGAYPAAGGFISTSDAVIFATNIDTATLNEAKIHFYAMCVDLRDASTI